MITLREAIQRLSMYRMRIIRLPNASFKVVFHEDKQHDEFNSYVTDDLLDAVIAGGRMRKRRLQAI